jgi:hypothetical protein
MCDPDFDIPLSAKCIRVVSTAASERRRLIALSLADTRIFPIVFAFIAAPTPNMASIYRVR